MILEETWAYSFISRKLTMIEGLGRGRDMLEPVGGGRFVVLEHVWDGVHWDFMLEAGNGLRTWSTDAPIEHGCEILARSRTDHRLDYLSYEGPISGDRGSVRRIAEGVFQTIAWEPGHIRVKLLGSQLVGEVDLYRSGSDSMVGSTWKFRLGKVD
jgi:hypothetical protein